MHIWVPSPPLCGHTAWSMYFSLPPCLHTCPSSRFLFLSYACEQLRVCIRNDYRTRIISLTRRRPRLTQIVGGGSTRDGGDTTRQLTRRPCLCRECHRPVVCGTEPRVRRGR